MMINSDSVSDKGKQCSDLSMASTQQNVFFLTGPQSQFIQDARLCSPSAEESKAKKEESIESYHDPLPWGAGCSLQALVWGSNKETWYEIVKLFVRLLKKHMRGQMFTAVSKHNNEVCLLPSGLVCLIVGPLSRVRILFLKSWVNLIHKKTPLNHSAVLIWNLDIASTRSTV